MKAVKMNFMGLEASNLLNDGVLFELHSIEQNQLSVLLFHGWMLDLFVYDNPRQLEHPNFGIW